MPEYPETRTSSGVPVATTRWNELRRVATSRVRPYSFSRDQQSIRHVVRCERKLVDALLSFPFSKAVPKITLNTGRCLVAFLSSFGQQLHDNCGDSRRDIVKPLTGGDWLSGDVAVHPLRRIGRLEGKSPS